MWLQNLHSHCQIMGKLYLHTFNNLNGSQTINLSRSWLQVSTWHTCNCCWLLRYKLYRPKVTVEAGISKREWRNSQGRITECSTTTRLWERHQWSENTCLCLGVFPLWCAAPGLQAMTFLRRMIIWTLQFSCFLDCHWFIIKNMHTYTKKRKKYI